MSAHYDPTLPRTIDRMRFALGDTVVEPVTSALIEDETYTAMLAYHAQSEPRAIIALAQALIARYAREPDRVDVEGKTIVSWRDRLLGWKGLIATLTAEQQSLAALAAGGVIVRKRSRDVEQDATAEYIAHGRGPLDQERWY